MQRFCIRSQTLVNLPGFSLCSMGRARFVGHPSAIKEHTNNEPTISVIIPCHDNADFLELILQSIQSQASTPEETICVDDASNRYQSQAIASLCHTYGAVLKTLPLSSVKRLGRRSMTRRVGTKAAGGEVLLYLDGDMILGPDYVAGIRSIHVADKRALVKGIRRSISISEQNRGGKHCLWVACDPANDSGGIEYEYYPPRDGSLTSSLLNGTCSTSCIANMAAPGTESTVLHPLLPTVQWLRQDGLGIAVHRRQWSLPYSDRWDYCASNNLSVRRQEVEQIGNWDEHFLGWGEEDLDFAYRLFRNGCRPVLPQCGPVYAYHLDHRIEREANGRSLRRNARYFVHKYPEMALYRSETYRHFGLEPQQLLEEALHHRIVENQAARGFALTQLSVGIEHDTLASTQLHVYL